MTNVFFILSFEQFLICFSSKKTHLCTISCKCVQMNHNPLNIQCVLCVFKGVYVYNGVLNVIYPLIYDNILQCTCV